MLKPERVLAGRMAEFYTPQEAFEWLVNKGIIDHKRCRVFVMRAHYTALIESGVSKMDALTATADEYSVSEPAVQEALYRFKDM